MRYETLPSPAIRVIRRDTFASSRYLYRERQLVERFFNRNKQDRKSVV